MQSSTRSLVLCWYVASLLLLVVRRAPAQAAQLTPKCELPANPFALARVVPRIPAGTPPKATEQGVIVGTVTDSATGRGLRGAIVRITPLGGTAAELIGLRPDSTGALVSPPLKAGLYQREALSVFFYRRLDTVAIRPGLDSMSIVLSHGPAYCAGPLDDVRVSKPPR